MYVLCVCVCVCVCVCYYFFELTPIFNMQIISCRYIFLT